MKNRSSGSSGGDADVLRRDGAVLCWGCDLAGSARSMKKNQEPKNSSYRSPPSSGTSQANWKMSSEDDSALTRKPSKNTRLRRPVGSVASNPRRIVRMK
jgi:hypothetical protein